MIKTAHEKKVEELLESIDAGLKITVFMLVVGVSIGVIKLLEISQRLG